MRVPQDPGQPIGSVEVQPAATPFIRAQAADTTRSGRELAQIGQGMGQLAGTIADMRRQTALLEASAEYDALERQMFDPNTGIFTRLQGNAIGITDAVNEQMGAFRSDIMNRYGGRLSNSGKLALEQMLDGAQQRAWNRAAGHELGEGMKYEQNLLRASIEGQINRAASLYTNPAEVDAAEFQVRSLANDYADRVGMSGPERELFVADQLTSMHLSIVEQKAATGDPVGAVAHLEAALAAGAVNSQKATRALSQLKPLADAHLGQQWAVAAATGAPPPGAVTSGSITQGPIPGTIDRNNPGALADDTMSALGRKPLDDTPFAKLNGWGGNLQRAIADAAAAGHTITMTSGYRSPDHQAQIIAANWHKFDLNPADVAKWTSDVQALGAIEAGNKWAPIFNAAKRTVADGRGTPFRNWIGLPGQSNHQHGMAADLGFGSAEARQWMHENAAKYGMHFPLSNESWHIEPIGSRDGTYAGGAALPSGAGPAAVEAVDPQSPEAVLASIEDPNVRAAAFEEFDRMQAAAQTRWNREQTARTNQLYAEIERAAIAGEEFPLDQYLAQDGNLEYLGDHVKGIRDYWTERTSGKKVETAPETIHALRVMAEADPDVFAAEDLVKLRTTGQLSEAHFEELTKKQAAIAGKRSSGVGYMPSEVSGLLSVSTGGMSPEERGNIERQTMDYISAHIAENKVAPTETQVIGYAERLASRAGPSATIRPERSIWNIFGGATRGDLTTVLTSARSMDLATILSSELTLPVPMRDGSVREVKFTEDQMEAAVDLFLGKDPDTGLVPNGSIAPTPTELITLLILMESDAL